VNKPSPDDVDEASNESFPASDPPAWTNVVGPHADGVLSEAVRSTIHVVNNEAEKRFEAQTPHGVAELRYRYRGPRVIVLLHTEVPTKLRGNGIAGLLAGTALEFARDHGLSVVPVCPFVVGYLEHHPELEPLVVK
jgi:hypothetical protein